MSKEIILMLHPTFGVLAVLAALWVLVETIQAKPDNYGRIKIASLATTVLVWLAYLIGGYWYVKYYGVDKAIVKAGPWPFAHSLFMETKEHLFFVMLLLSIYLPIVVTSGAPLADRGTRQLVVAVAGLVVLFGLAMEGAGAIVGLGVRMGLSGG